MGTLSQGRTRGSALVRSHIAAWHKRQGRISKMQGQNGHLLCPRLSPAEAKPLPGLGKWKQLLAWLTFPPRYKWQRGITANGRARPKFDSPLDRSTDRSRRLHQRIYTGLDRSLRPASGMQRQPSAFSLWLRSNERQNGVDRSTVKLMEKKLMFVAEQLSEQGCQVDRGGPRDTLQA